MGKELYFEKVMFLEVEHGVSVIGQLSFNLKVNFLILYSIILLIKTKETILNLIFFIHFAF